MPFGRFGSAATPHPLTVKCKSLSKVSCEAEIPVTPADNNKTFVILLPGKVLGVTLSVNKRGTKVNEINPHALKGLTRYQLTLTVPKKIPGGTKVICSFRLM